MTAPPLDAGLHWWRLPGMMLRGQAQEQRFYGCQSCGFALVKWCEACECCAPHLHAPLLDEPPLCDDIAQCKPQPAQMEMAL